MSWRTSSNLERVETCPASVVLPGFSYSGEAAAQGTKNHEAAERGQLPRRLLASTLECEPTTTRREVSFVLDVRKRAVVRQAAGAREYGELDEWEVGTTPDFFGSLGGGRWRSRDWKSRKLVTTASQNPQIITQALAIFATRNAALVDAGLGYLAQDDEDAHTFTVFDVPAMWARLERIIERGHAAKASDVHESQHCDYCRCLTTCPAKRAAIVQLGVELPDLEATDDAGRYLVPAAKVGELHNVLTSVEKIVERAKELVKARARREDIPVGGGKVLRLIESSRKSLDQERAKQLITSSGLDVADFEKVTPYTQVREVKAK